MTEDRPGRGEGRRKAAAGLRAQHRIVFAAINGQGPHRAHSDIQVSVSPVRDSVRYFNEHKFRLIEALRDVTVIPREVGDAWMAKALELDPEAPRQALPVLAKIIGCHQHEHREQILSLAVANCIFSRITMSLPSMMTLPLQL